MKKSLIAAVLAATGLGFLSWNALDEPSTNPKPSFPTTGKKIQGELSPPIPQVQNTDSAPRSTGSAPPSIVQTAPLVETENQPQKQEFKSDGECIAHMFYKRSLSKNQTPDERFSNFRWAIEQFPGTTLSDKFENAAKALATDKTRLIADLRTAAVDVFKNTQTSDYKTNLDWINHWNNLRIAHPYTGLTNTGEFNQSLSMSAVSYDEESLKRNRDTYVLNAAMDIFQSIEGQIKTMHNDYTEKIKGGTPRGTSLSEVLEKLTFEQKRKLREQIDIIIYVTDTLLSQDSESYLKVGIDRNTYDLLQRIKRSEILEQKIYNDLAKQCRTPS